MAAADLPACPAIDPSALARLIFAGQAQPTALPRLAGIAPTLSYTAGDTVSLAIAKDFARVGLGSLALWERSSAHPHIFLQEALDSWLEGEGAHELEHKTGLSLSISMCPDGAGEGNGSGWVYFTVETTECGYLELGGILDALDGERAGLGAAFYHTLLAGMNQWMNSYNHSNAEMHVESWRESIQMDVDEARRAEPAAPDFEEYCRENGIELPDLAALPRAVHARPRSHRAALRLLRAHARGPHAARIETALTLARLRPTVLVDSEELRDESSWDDAPLPTWLICFRPRDAVVQCFDADANSMHESNHEPTCLFRYRPGDTRTLRSILKDLAAFILVNRLLAQLE